MENLGRIPHCVLLQMLPHIPLLSEAFSANLADEGLNSEVHPEVVEEVPSPHELFPTSWVITSIHDNRFPILRVLPILGLVGEVLQLPQVLNIGL